MKSINEIIHNVLIKKLEKLVSVMFLFGTSFVLLLLSQSIFLASINFFKLIPMLIACLISFTVSIYFLYLIRKEINFFPKVSFLLILILISVSLILVFYPHDNFGGTDNGGYINLAFYLAKNGSFNSPSYIKTIPLWVQTTKTSLPAYPIWLATQKILLGTSAAVRGNLLLIILGFLSLFSVASMIKDKKMGLMSVALFATCMPFLWFSRETMNESLTFFLLWTAVFFFISFFKTRQLIFIAYLLLATLLLCFTRPEGLFISLFTLFAFIFFIIYKKLFSKRKLLLIITPGFLLILTFFFIIYKSSYSAYIISNITSAIRSIKIDVSYILKGRPYLLQRLPFFFAHMLIKYNFFLVIFFPFLVLPKLLFFSKNRSSSKIYFFAIFFIIVIEFSKLIDPGIQILQPWFYRRYLYALLPFGYLSLSFFLCNLKNKRVSIILFSLFFIINLVLSFPIILLKHNWSLYAAMNQISNNVTTNDLIIIKNANILGYYYPQNYFMMQKSIRAIYTFDMNDKELSLKNKTYKGYSFEKLYFLSDKYDDSYKNYSIVSKQTIDVDFLQLKPSCELDFMIKESGVKNLTDYYLIPYSHAINYCKYPYNEIVKFNKKLYLYQLN